MNIGSFKDFVEKVNTDLGGDFCSKFAYKRKELAGLSKAPTVRVLFVFVDDDRDWAINSGGGYEIQFHLYIRNNEVGYGLGFNTQYVPFNNSDAVECMKPFGKAFLELLSSYKNEWKEKGFGWIEGDGVKMLRNPHHQCYTLYGKKIAINNSQIDDDKYQTMLSDIKGTLFDIYKKVFKLKNTKYQSQQMEDLANMTGLLEANKNIILQGAPGTGKTYSTAALALSIIGISDVDFSDHVAVMKKYEALLINEKNKDGQIGFCTFHQSMDYEDFVEGLKPSISENGDSVTYKIEPGIFKIICDKALAIQSNNFDQSWNDLIEKLEIETKWSVPLISGKGSFNIELNEYGTGLAVRTYEDGSDSWIKGKSKFFSKDQLYNVYMGQPGVPSGGHDTYRKAVVQEMRKSFNLTDYDPNLPKNENKRYVLIIDEINRGNISKIFGELISCLENDKRTGDVHPIEVMLPYSKKSFSVPSNLYIIGTMNTTDRSTGSIDYAVRRRFAFVTLKSDRSLVESKANHALALYDAVRNFIQPVDPTIDMEDLMVGHSYFFGKQSNLPTRWKYEIYPLLVEYYKDGLIKHSPVAKDINYSDNMDAFIQKYAK